MFIKVLLNKIGEETKEQHASQRVKGWEFSPTGEAEKRYFEKEFFREVNIGEFYRVEVISSFGIVAYSKEKLEQDKGFAYTNPIWIE